MNSATISPAPNMVFVTAGMGGGTGTGAAPVIAKTRARTWASSPFGVVNQAVSHFEGQRPPCATAESGHRPNCTRVVDTLLIIPNQNLFPGSPTKKRPLSPDAFRDGRPGALYSGRRPALPT